MIGAGEQTHGDDDGNVVRTDHYKIGETGIGTRFMLPGKTVFLEQYEGTSSVTWPIPGPQEVAPDEILSRLRDVTHITETRATLYGNNASDSELISIPLVPIAGFSGHTIKAKLATASVVSIRDEEKKISLIWQEPFSDEVHDQYEAGIVAQDLTRLDVDRALATTAMADVAAMSHELGRQILGQLRQS